MAGRAGRPLPGQSQKSGHGLDLGQLLMDIYGGVDVNKEAGQAPEVGPPTVGESQPYFKPKTIFDRRQAAMANTEKTYGELQQQQEIANALKLRAGEVPIDVSRQGLMNREAEKTSGILDNQKQLSSRGILVDPQHLSNYDTDTYSTNRNTTIVDALNALAGAGNVARKVDTSNEILDKTKRYQIDEAAAKANKEASLAIGDQANIPTYLHGQAAAARFAPLKEAATISHLQNIPMREGEQLYNPALGRSVFSVPSKEQQMLNSLKTGQLLNNATNPVPSGTAPMGQPVGNGFQRLDENSVMIGGVVYGRSGGNSSDGFNPYSKF